MVAYLWGLLAAEAGFRFGGGTVEHVARRRSHLGTGFDDAQVKTRQSDETRRWFLQAKRTIFCRESDAAFREVVQRAGRDSAKPDFTNDGFVIVTERIGDKHREALTELVGHGPVLP